MPCSEPVQSTSDKQAERTAKAIVILSKKLGVNPPAGVKELIGGYSFHGKYCNQLTAFLCEQIRGLSAEQVESIVYNAHDKESRFLADWWDEHKKADEQHGRG